MFAPHYENYLRDSVAFALSLLPIVTLFGLSAAAWAERMKKLRSPLKTPKPGPMLGKHNKRPVST
jgi:hypothetical protein